MSADLHETQRATPLVGVALPAAGSASVVWVWVVVPWVSASRLPLAQGLECLLEWAYRLVEAAACRSGAEFEWVSASLVR